MCANRLVSAMAMMSIGTHLVIMIFGYLTEHLATTIWRFARIVAESSRNKAMWTIPECCHACKSTAVFRIVVPGKIYDTLLCYSCGDVAYVLKIGRLSPEDNKDPEATSAANNA